MKIEEAKTHKKAKTLDKENPPPSSLGHSHSEAGFELPMMIRSVKRVPRPVVDIKSKFVKVDFKKLQEDIKARDKARAEFVAERNAKREEEEKIKKAEEAQKRAAAQAKVAAEKAARDAKQAEELAAAKELVKAARAGGA